jgi:nitrogen fixation/metabolism regulation signal transduction histidine kinase
VTLRSRLILAFLALALIPIGLMSLFALDRLGRAIELWNTPGVDRALESALEVSKTSLARMDATVSAQAEDWAAALAPGPLPTAQRTAVRAGMRAAGLDFVQLYHREAGRWRLVEEVRPAGVLAAMALDLSAELEPALAGDRLIHSRRGALAAAARIGDRDAVVAGMQLYPGFFEEMTRVGEGVGFYRRFHIVRDVSRAYVLLLVAALAIVLAAVAVWVATRLAHGMTRPLRELSAALERVAGGDLTARVAPHGAPELRALGERFNAMTERLATARAALQEAEREAAWREVARRLAHEFKNILTPMSLSLHRLDRRVAAVATEQRAPVEDSLAALRRGVDQLARLAEQFSQYARLPEPRFERVDLDQVVREAIALHEHEGVPVIMTGGAPLPVCGDSLLLSRAVHNLVLNACEASRAGSAVEVRTASEGGNAVVDVMDRGSGLPPDVRDRLFEPYVSTKGRGSGLGLSLVRDIALQHRGSVALEDREGGGAHARLSVPLVEEGGREAASA